MSRIVQKYGGSSLANVERISAVAERIAKRANDGVELIVIVSAMAGETDRLISLAQQLSTKPNDREMDVLLSTGEQVSAALLSISLQNLGLEAITLLGYQVPIVTDSAHTRARIMAIEALAIESALQAKQIVIIPGFQGITVTGDITTLGRGGSDTSAVAVAAALKADHCEIYSDVDGILTADPRIVPDAKKIPFISSEELLEMAGAGAKVVQMRAVELAAKHRVPLELGSSFSEGRGTSVIGHEESLEKTIVSGVTLTKNEGKISIRSIPDRSAVAKALFEPIARENINVDMIVQTINEAGFSDLAFTVSKEDMVKALQLAEAAALIIQAGKVEAAADVAKLSIIGIGMRSHAGVAAKMFEVLGNHNINIQLISTSEIKVSVVIDMIHADQALRQLHEAFSLGR